MFNSDQCISMSIGWTGNTRFLKGEDCDLLNEKQIFRLERNGEDAYSILKSQAIGQLPRSLDSRTGLLYPIMVSCTGTRVGVQNYISRENAPDDWIKNQLVNGPVQVAVNAESQQHHWFNYTKDTVIRKNTGCTSKIDHAVVIVGWKVFEGIEVWVIRNSWGSGWGDNGYALLEIDQNANGGHGACGVNRYPYALTGTHTTL